MDERNTQRFNDVIRIYATDLNNDFFVLVCRYNISTPVREIMGRYFRFADDLRTQHATAEDVLSHKMAVPANNKIRFDSTLSRRTLPGYHHINSIIIISSSSGPLVLLTELSIKIFLSSLSLTGRSSLGCCIYTTIYITIWDFFLS